MMLKKETLKLMVNYNFIFIYLPVHASINLFLCFIFIVGGSIQFKTEFFYVKFCCLKSKKK